MGLRTLATAPASKCSCKIKLYVFAALVLCAAIVLLSQMEEVERHVKYLHKPQTTQRKLQAVISKKSSSENFRENNTFENNHSANPVTTPIVDLAEDNVPAKSSIDYSKIIIELLEDNKLLQLKLNETMRLLKKCVGKKSFEENVFVIKPTNVVDKVRTTRSNISAATDVKNKQMRVDGDIKQNLGVTSGGIVGQRKSHEAFSTRSVSQSNDLIVENAKLLPSSKHLEMTATDAVKRGKKSDQELPNLSKKNISETDNTARRKYLNKKASRVFKAEKNSYVANPHRTITQSNDNLKDIIKL